ncbi:Probable inactive receptor kinase At2g26730 [Linum perenne]
MYKSEIGLPMSGFCTIIDGNAENASACGWVGVGCDANQSVVHTLRLSGADLVGPIPTNTLGKLSQLRVLSIRSNRLPAEIPPDFSNLTLLRSLYLQNNAFSGGFPASVTRLTRLAHLDLSSNSFKGPIPFSVNNWTQLTGLFLENNRFSGPLPRISSNLVGFNVSNNNLNGCVADHCLPALRGVLALFLLLLFLLCCLRKKKRQQSPKPPKPVGAARVVPVEAGTASSKDDITGASADVERNKLVFFEGGIYSFDLEDL